MIQALFRALVVPAVLFVSIEGFAGDSKASLQSQAKLTKEQATKIAMSKVPNGKVQSAELEKEKGRLVWSFDIAIPNSKNVAEIQIDAKTGAVISNEVETPADQAKEAAADKRAKKTK